VRSGRFATTLGDACPGAAPLDESVVPPGSPRWIELAVEGVTLLPRIQVSSVPSASLALRSLDTEALRSKLSSAGALNTADNPVDWTQLKNVPADVAAGGNYAAGGGLQLVGKQFSVASGGIGTAQIAAGAVTNAQIAAGTITADRLAGGIPLTATIGSLDATRLTDAAVTSAKIVDAAILSTKIAAGAVGTVHLSDGAVTGAKIAAGAITGVHVADGSLGIEKISGGIPLSATTGSLDASRLTGSLPANMVPSVVKAGNVTDACTSANAGTIRWTGTKFQGCDGTKWTSLGGAPTVSGVSPTKVPSGGGSVVTIDGTNFTASTQIKFGSVAASSVTFVSGTRVTAVMPATTTLGNVSVTAVSSDGETAAWAGTFTVGAGGDTAATAGTTCYTLKQEFSTLGDGTYWIKPSGVSSAFQAFCDMTTEGGGYTYYPVGSGISTSRNTDNNSCRSLGMDIVFPRSKAHLQAMIGKYGTSYFSVMPGVYGTQSGVNYTGCAMRNPSHYGSGCGDWRVGDGGRWWLRDSAYSEPNGDYTPGCWLGTRTADPNDMTFNDGYCGSSTSSYICSTNDKP
jgi:hypothetical protein